MTLCLLLSILKLKWHSVSLQSSQGNPYICRSLYKRFYDSYISGCGVAVTGSAKLVPQYSTIYWLVIWKRFNFLSGPLVACIIG